MPFQESHGESCYPFFSAGYSQPVAGCGFYVDLVRVYRQGPSHVRCHLLDEWGKGGPLGDYCSIHVFDAPTCLSEFRGNGGEESQAVGVLVGVVGGREPAPDIPHPRRPQESINHGVGECVSVTVAGQAERVRYGDAPQYEGSALYKGVNVDSHSYAHNFLSGYWPEARTRDLRIISASFRSSGLVTFKLVGEPGVSFILIPRRSTIEASSVTFSLTSR